MRKLILALAVVVMCGGSAWARDLELEKLVIACSKQETDENKLKCLDSLSTTLKDLHEGDLERGTEFSNNWILHRKTSPMNDSKTFIASIRGVDEIKKERATLVLRCSENKTSSYIVWDDILDYSGDVNVVEYRIDDKKAIKSRWNLSTDSKATFAPQEIKFAKSLGGANKLIVRTSYYHESPSIVTFNLDGIDGILEELQKTCNWK